MVTATFLEILENSAVKLEDVLKSLAQHERPRLLTTDPTGAEHDDGLLLHLPGQSAYGLGELAKVVDAQRLCPAEGSQLHLIIIARVQQRERASLVQPLFERAGGELRRRTCRRVNPLHSEGDDFLFDPDQHARERLLRAFAELRREFLQSGNGPQFRDQMVNLFPQSGHEQIDTLLTQQNRALQAQGLAPGHQPPPQGFEIAQTREFVGGDVGEHG